MQGRGGGRESRTKPANCFIKSELRTRAREAAPSFNVDSFWRRIEASALQPEVGAYLRRMPDGKAELRRSVYLSRFDVTFQSRDGLARGRGACEPPCLRRRQARAPRERAPKTRAPSSALEEASWRLATEAHAPNNYQTSSPTRGAPHVACDIAPEVRTRAESMWPGRDEPASLPRRHCHLKWSLGQR